ncbi:hypothetical protein F1188_12330 [Roseospira marina]|uniref:Cytochrome c n=1 Tax=Roseospira marina TaxID=140057 RepID=A0A5M6IBS7_9PROT|nr:hypothetical protein [Roseospira marina]KAA5605068.1 hypothetical protein F1188_12330 [Roseospira marina]MBB4314813.1 mono/diheme cytochrome c family protein [Roseospira marina]MBB5087813.1 mono/diheme cytochrome c family protein [Roseospira marina]
MIPGRLQPALGVAAVLVMAVLPIGAHAAEASDGEPRRIIAEHCVRCHPPLPDGAGWMLLTEQRRDRAAWASEVRRMSEAYDTHPNTDERRVLLDYLATAWGPTPAAPATE